MNIKEFPWTQADAYLGFFQNRTDSNNKNYYIRFCMLTNIPVMELHEGMRQTLTKAKAYMENQEIKFKTYSILGFFWELKPNVHHIKKYEATLKKEVEQAFAKPEASLTESLRTDLAKIKKEFCDPTVSLVAQEYSSGPHNSPTSIKMD